MIYIFRQHQKKKKEFIENYKEKSKNQLKYGIKIYENKGRDILSIFKTN